MKARVATMLSSQRVIACAKGHPHSRENGYAGQGMREAQPGITVFVRYPVRGAASEHTPREIRHRP
jgi:hypothetical protein